MKPKLSSVALKTSKFFGVFVLICIAATSATASEGGPCEGFGNETSEDYGEMKFCLMWTTVIDSKDFLITSDRDETVNGFYAKGNKKLNHLPKNFDVKFPNLLVLIASDCSVKEVSKGTFKGLGKLRVLHFQRNQIEKIDDDTFEHIPAIETIWLSGNKIKKLNGLAFASLHKLTTVHLRTNECIDEDFEGATRIADLPRVVTGKCGFNEFEQSSAEITGGS